MSLRDLAADPQLRANEVDAFDSGKMRGMISTISSIHLKVAKERKSITQQQEHLEQKLVKQAANHKVVQKALGVQVSAANRGYAALLTEHQGTLVARQDLQDQVALLRKTQQEELKQREHIFRSERMEYVHKISGLERELGGLQVERSTLKSSLSWYEKELGNANVVWESQTQVKEHAYGEVCTELESAKCLLEAERKQAQKAESKWSADIEVAHAQVRGQAVQIAELENAVVTHQEKVCELEAEAAALLVQEGGDGACDDVDQKVSEAVRIKEEGYQNLVDDFVTMQAKNHDEMERMRIEYQAIVKTLEVDAKVTEDKAKKKKLYLEEQLAMKVRDARELRDMLTELKENTEHETHQLEVELAETRRELKVAHDVITNINLKEKQNKRATVDGGNKSMKEEKTARQKALRMENDMQQMLKEAEAVLTSKDEEINDLMAGNGRLQRKLVLESEKLANQEITWDERFQVKERVMDDLREEIKGIEEHVGRERQVSESLREEIKGKQHQFIVLDIAYRKQIAARMQVEKQLQKENEALEERIEAEIEKQAAIREHGERMLAQEREEKQKMKEEFEEEMAELKEIIERKERLFQKASAELIAVREEMDEKEREADVKIKDLGRKIQTLRAEMNFSLELAEEKYQRLLQELKQLQDKYDREMAHGGVQAMKKQIALLRNEIQTLQDKISTLNATILQLHSDIREHLFEIDETRRETADLLFTKENAYRDMCAQIPPLEQKIEDEKKRRDKDIEEKDKELKLLHKACGVKLMEKDAVIASLQFNDRDDLLADTAKWRERYLAERDKIVQIEMHYVELIGKQHEAAAVVTGENAELQRQLEAEKAELVKFRAKNEKEVASLNVRYDLDLAAKSEQCDALKQQIEALNIKFASEVDALTKEPDYVVEYRETIATQALELKAAEEGRKQIVEDDAQKRQELMAARKNQERVTDNFTNQLEEVNLKLQKSELKYEDYKKALSEELATAEATCREMEKKMLNLPNPFAEELAELKEEMRKMVLMYDAAKNELEMLQAKVEEERHCASTEKAALEEKVALASMVLREVDGLQSLKSLAEVERFLGVDLDGDGKIG